jgi:hypothetical protein
MEVGVGSEGPNQGCGAPETGSRLDVSGVRKAELAVAGVERTHVYAPRRGGDEVGFDRLRGDEVRKRPRGRIEERDGDRGLAQSDARLSSRRRRCPLSRRSQSQERFGGGGAAEPLVRPQDEVVGEGVLEPSLQVADGERAPEPKARGVLEGSPEAFEARRSVGVLFRGKALDGAEAGDGSAEHSADELAPEIGDHVLRSPEG